MQNPEQETSIVFSKKEVDSIDMYVSNDGKVTALSVSGLAMLCGVSHQIISRLLSALDDSDATKPVPESLEHLRGKVFLTAPYKIECSPTGGGANTKLVYSKVSSRIIRYYAYESKVSNQTAKDSYDKFADRGIDDWIKECTGFDKEKPSAAKAITMSIEAMEALHAIVAEHIADAKIIKNDIPGVGTLLSAYKEQKSLPPNLPEPFLLVEYLETKMVKVDDSCKRSFAYFLSGYYRGNSLAMPEKIKYRGDKYIGNANTYTFDKLPLLDSAWENFTNVDK